MGLTSKERAEKILATVKHLQLGQQPWKAYQDWIQLEIEEAEREAKLLGFREHQEGLGCANDMKVQTEISYRQGYAAAKEQAKNLIVPHGNHEYCRDVCADRQLLAEAIEAMKPEER